MFDNSIPRMKITKLKAARDQIETAIQEYFTGGHAVSVHTLAAAAHRVLHDINKAIGGPPSLRDSVFIRSGMEKEWHQLVTEAENFFKHADRDATKLLKFAPKRSEYLLAEACLIYRSITGKRSALMKLFIVWMQMRKPHIFRPAPEYEPVLAKFREDYRANDRYRFYCDMFLRPHRHRSCRKKDGG